MKVLLLENVDNLGETGDIINVKNGYGRNFLIPQKLALLATAGTIKRQEEEMRQASRKRNKLKDDATAQATELEKSEVVISVKVGEENRIFGTVTTQQIAVSLVALGFEIDRKAITINEEIRVIGVYSATVKLHKDISAQLKISVVPASEPVANDEA